jgi:hypothetical protein
MAAAVPETSAAAARVKEFQTNKKGELKSPPFNQLAAGLGVGCQLHRPLRPVPQVQVLFFRRHEYPF